MKINLNEFFFYYKIVEFKILRKRRIYNFFLFKLLNFLGSNVEIEKKKEAKDKVTLNKKNEVLTSPAETNFIFRIFNL